MSNFLKSSQKFKNCLLLSLTDNVDLKLIIISLIAKTLRNLLKIFLLNNSSILEDRWQDKNTNSMNSEVKLATLVENDLKAPFSIATTQRCRRGHYSILLIAPSLPLILIILSVKQGSIKYHFFYFIITLSGLYHYITWTFIIENSSLSDQSPAKKTVWLNLGLNLGPPDHWQTLYSLGQRPSWIVMHT